MEKPSPLSTRAQNSIKEKSRQTLAHGQHLAVWSFD